MGANLTDAFNACVAAFPAANVSWSRGWFEVSRGERVVAITAPAGEDDLNIRLQSNGAERRVGRNEFVSAVANWLRLPAEVSP